MGLENGNVEIGRFPDGEVSVVLKEDIEGKEVTVIGSTEPPAENLIELLFIVHKVAGGGAAKISAILPYFGYSRGDREARKGEVVTAEVAARILAAVGGKNLEIVTIDPHSPKISGFFEIPFNEISVVENLARSFSGQKDLTVVAPDLGALVRAEKFAKACGVERIVSIVKERLAPDRVQIKEVIGKVGTRAVIVDDMVQTGGTILEVAGRLKEAGARSISVAATHMIYSAGGWEKLANSELIDRVVATNTIAPPANLPGKFELIDIAPVLKQAIND